MAQDFRRVFGLGADDTSIATEDADGVALTAIQALNEAIQEKDSEIHALKQRLEKLERSLAELHLQTREWQRTNHSLNCNRWRFRAQLDHPRP